MTMPAPSGSIASKNIGSQTLARGLRALELVAASRNGLTMQEVADALDVHRTIAYRMLSTLADFHLVTRLPDGRFRAGAGLAALAALAQGDLREVALPVLRELADTLECTLSLIVAEGEEAVAVAVIEPTTTVYHLAFRTGSRHRLDRGAAGLALRAAGPRRSGEAPEVTLARQRGYASTYGQVEPGAYGLAVPLRQPPSVPAACINLITYRADLIDSSIEPMRQAAERISTALA
ncbi:transcriptional regulator [Micromonospora sonchi]|uniref:Transcriptional regulator n=1 Tax=Micromonospora sonchi TaxID=1763543 RepID=A0A917X2D8_9ACTN|nr:helix-turn-helix domain-containing protein [Micromonospora sonchi]GGM56112.1 transcriptional regulator [Micromonospora sonchi]